EETVATDQLQLFLLPSIPASGHRISAPVQATCVALPPSLDSSYTLPQLGRVFGCTGGRRKMCSIYDLVKEQEMCVADVDDNVMEVAQAMVERNIGAVPVVREGRLAGVFSERDLMRRIVVEGRDPHATKVGEVMTREPLSVSRN